MEKKSNDKTVTELINELENNEKEIEKVLKIFQGHAVTIRTQMFPSAESIMCINKLDWTYLIGLNQQNYIYISEHPFESKVGATNLTFDVDEVDEVEYSKNTLRIWFQDGLRLYVILKKE